jgi:hypothetical protein
MFVHKSFKIQNEVEKMKALGCEEFEFVTRREDIFLFIINYLGCVTLTQFTELIKETPMSNRAILIRLEKDKLITADHINKEVYYRCTKKGVDHLRTYSMPRKSIKIKKRKHLEKINDFFLHLFRSPCNQITIDHEVAYEYGDFNNLCKTTVNDEVDYLHVHKFIADAQIKLSHKGDKYNIVLEQDNGTERIEVLKDKISKYLNFILHQELKSTEIKIYIFRVDIEITNFQLKKFQKIFNKEVEDNINIVKQLANLYKRVKQSDDITTFFEEAKELRVQEDCSKQNFLNNISNKKVWIEGMNSLYKILIYNKFKSKINTNRLKDINNLLFDEVAIDKFYDTGDNSIFFNITGHLDYSSMDSRIEARKIMLRANFICADNKTDYLLLSYLFSDYDYLKKCIESYLCDNGLSNIKIDRINKKQRVIKLGDETVSFDFATTMNINNEDVEFILLYPNIFISDVSKVWHIATLDYDEIDSCLNNQTVFFVYHDKNVHDIAINNLGYKTCSKAKFYINKVNDNEWQRSCYKMDNHNRYKWG